MKKSALLLSAFVIGSCFAFEYNVRQPSDVLKPKWFASDTQPGVWTMNVNDALGKAAAAGKYTLVLNTASWWCPYCETLEDMVLGSENWKNYVATRGFYLGMLDFPYRGHVSDDQLWKSYYPELGDGWGFKCWLMNPGYLAEIGLTKEQGFDAIMDLYEIQKSLAPATATPVKFKHWKTGEDFNYGKVGYPTILVFGTDGKELGRMSFPWYRASDVTSSEAQEYVIQAIERIITGECTVCADPESGAPDVSAAQEYTGWLRGADGAIAGLIAIKTGKVSGKGAIAVSGSVRLGGKTVSFKRGSADVDIGEKVKIEEFTLTAKKGASAKLHVGEAGLYGTYTDGVSTYTITGARNVFKSKDAASKALAAASPTGTWSLYLKPTDKTVKNPFARGYGALSMTLSKKGQVKIAGYLGDGTKVGAASEVIVGNNGLVCVPVSLGAYSGKGGVGFVVWFKDGRLLSIDQVSKWVSPKKNVFECGVEVSSTIRAGMGNVPEVLDLTILDLPKTTTIKERALAYDQSEDVVRVNKTKWEGTEITDFSAKCNSKSGLLTGTMNFRTIDGKGKVRDVAGDFYGVVMGGSGYGTVVVKGEGSWAVKIAVCGSCGE